MSRRGKTKAAPVRSCACCGCTDVTPCVHPNGQPCHWIDADLCSGCVEGVALHPQIAVELDLSGYTALAERLRERAAIWLDSQPRVELATEGDLNALLRATRGLACARKAGA